MKADYCAHSWCYIFGNIINFLKISKDNLALLQTATHRVGSLIVINHLLLSDIAGLQVIILRSATKNYSETRL